MALILIIDDEQDMRSLLRRALSRAGHWTVEAADGRAGIEALAAHPVDLIVTDMLMPEMDGIELLFHLRQARSALPIIAMSGGGHAHPESYLRAARAAGASRTLAKPFKLGDLVEAVNACLAESGKAASGDPPPAPASPPPPAS